MRVSTVTSAPSAPSPVPRMIAASGTSVVRARTARTAASIMRLLAVERAQLGQLALEQRPEAGHVRLELACDFHVLPLHLALRVLGLVEEPPPLGLRFAHDHLGLALRRGARLL